ncbi:MAG: hypothetical protein V4696_02040 [Pseudomonadota bacterium]
MSIDSRQFAAAGSDQFPSGNGAAEALDLMARALAILDANEAPADAGAYLDHAMHRLRDWIGSENFK